MSTVTVEQPRDLGAEFRAQVPHLVLDIAVENAKRLEERGPSNEVFLNQLLEQQESSSSE